MQKSKLTLYVFVALILGIVAGYFYNVHVISGINNKINAADAAIQSINTKLINLKDTTAADFKAPEVGEQQAFKVIKNIHE